MKTWKLWKLVLRDSASMHSYTLYRRCNGAIEIWSDERCVADWTAREVRRLYTKLAADYQ